MRREKRNQILGLGILVLSGIIICLCVAILWKYQRDKVEQPLGEMITPGEVEVLFDPFKTAIPDVETGEEFVTYGQCIRVFDALGIQEDKVRNSMDYRYLDRHFVMKEDFFRAYVELVLKKEQSVQQKSFFIIAGQEQMDLEKSGLSYEGTFFETDQGIIGYEEESVKQFVRHNYLEESGQIKSEVQEIADLRFHTIDCIVYQEKIMAVISTKKSEYRITNALIKDPSQGMVFHEGIYTYFPTEFFAEGSTEQVADLYFAEGTISEVKLKMEKISGKLLRVSEEGVEIEGHGFHSFADDYVIYDLIGERPDDSTEADLIIGYAFTDFVMEDGRVVACLIARREGMDTIRVLLRGPLYEGRFYETVTFLPDSELQVCYSDGTQETMAAGVEFCINAGNFEVGDRIFIRSAILSQRTQILEITRNQGNAYYRGTFELYRAEEGFVIINELPLEEYLYAVVPSEMPASYPIAALQAQAICARTYAYMNMLHAGISQFGAHVDDSAAFQVYQNASEFESTSQAVKNTYGTYLFYEGKPARTYYYSTSCGFGTNVSVWNGADIEQYGYMEPQRITDHMSDGTDDAMLTPEALQDNTIFDSFIRTNDGKGFESEESWYRWTYEVSNINSEKILERMQYRYGLNSSLVLTKQEDGTFASAEITEIGDIRDIEITQRLPGGVANECVITGTKNTVKLLTELVIRSVLCDGETKVVRQNGSEVAAESLLPSAFFSIEISKEGENVINYTLYGGGYGHGVGMSQNGAKVMADRGYSTEDILRFFYHNTEVKSQ